MKHSNLLTFAVVLLVIWLVASITKFIAGALLNLVLVAGVVFLAIWAVRRFR